jgi:release factor glutamine methyltransferase
MLDVACEPPEPAQQVLRRPAYLRLLGKLAGTLMAWLYRLRGKHRYDDFVVEHVQGMPLLVVPSVFNPKVPRTGEFLAANIDSRLVGAEFEILDMGTGSGVCALQAARYARRVVAVDINPAAVRCAHLNALLNHAEDRVDVRHGDLFEPVRGERFDLILFNPPFLRGTPRDDRERAWRSIDVAERFAAGLGAHLKPGGRALVVLSTFGEPGRFLSEFRKDSFTVSVFAERRFVNETLAIFELTPSRCGGGAT